MYRFSNHSRQNLMNVHPDLVAVTERALELTEVDFMVGEGRRSRERQAQLVREGKSQTMNSRHITGHAVDLFAWVDGVNWDWEYYYQIADAVQQASVDLDIPVRWGGSWHINDIRDWDSSMEEASNAYVDLRESQGRTPFLDGVHFELPRSHYE